jgi:hypothetical protein
MTRNRRRVAIACATVLLAVTTLSAGSALAAGGNAILTDCQANGQLTHSYTLKELRHALAIMPASVKQYTSCYDVIFQGIATVQHGKTTGPTGGGGSFLPTPVIIVLVVLILAGVTFGALAVRQRRAGGPPDGDAVPPGGDTVPPDGDTVPPDGDTVSPESDAAPPEHDDGPPAGATPADDRPSES